MAGKPVLDGTSRRDPVHTVKRWAGAFAVAGVTPEDSEPLRRQKAILTLGVVLKVMCCPVWVIGYGSLGLRVAAAAPLIYIMLSAGSTGRFLVDKRFPAYSTRQIAFMLALPAAMQYALGGYVSGSAVILWSLLAPLMAFLFQSARRAIPWMAAFVFLAAGSAVLEIAGIPSPARAPATLREFFFAMNVIMVALIVCATVRYFAVRLEAEQARSEALLFNVLPVSIADRLKRGEEPIADICPEVSVLFADIVGFTRLSAHVSPTEMVQMLNRMFSRFDTLASRHGLEKIRTIGDGYLAVAGLPGGRADRALASATAAAEMALDLQETVRALAAESGWPLSLRIGINSGGPITAGVIGTQKYVYDVWGDVVNTASRMESQGVPDAIQVTEATFQRLQDTYAFENRGLVEVKGKGQMRTYLLTSRAAIAAPIPNIA